MVITLRQCNQCGEFKDLPSNFFYKKQRGKYTETCKQCIWKKQKDSPGYKRAYEKRLAKKREATRLRQQNTPPIDPEIRRQRKYERIRNYNFMRLYGITLEDYNRMFLEQQGVCRICKQSPSQEPLCVDHCHTTGKVRGLLCASCNLMIGKSKEDVNILFGAIEYLMEGAS